RAAAAAAAAQAHNPLDALHLSQSGRLPAGTSGAVGRSAGGRAAVADTARRGPLEHGAWIGWTPRASKLALPLYQVSSDVFSKESAWALRYPIDARAVQVAVTPESGTVRTSLAAADVPLSPDRQLSFQEYARELTDLNLRRAWV